MTPHLGHRSFKGVQVQDHKVDGCNGVLRQVCLVVVSPPNGQQAAMNARMQGLDAPPQYLWRAGVLSNIGDLQRRVIEADSTASGVSRERLVTAIASASRAQARAARTGRPASLIAVAVPPVERISTPYPTKARARSTTPRLSVTEITARRTAVGVIDDSRKPQHPSTGPPPGAQEAGTSHKPSPWTMVPDKMLLCVTPSAPVRLGRRFWGLHTCIFMRQRFGLNEAGQAADNPQCSEEQRIDACSDGPTKCACAMRRTAVPGRASSAAVPLGPPTLDNRR